jgi:hypothetical protein
MWGCGAGDHAADLWGGVRSFEEGGEVDILRMSCGLVACGGLLAVPLAPPRCSRPAPLLQLWLYE